MYLGFTESTLFCKCLKCQIQDFTSATAGWGGHYSVRGATFYFLESQTPPRFTDLKISSIAISKNVLIVSQDGAEFAAIVAAAFNSCTDPRRHGNAKSRWIPR